MRAILGWACGALLAPWLVACGSSGASAADGGGGTDAGRGPPPATVLYDDFAQGSVSGAKWDNGQTQAVLQNGAALLSEAIAATQPMANHSSNLVVVPPGGNEVIWLQADVQVAHLTATGDTQARAGLDLVFQPASSRGVGEASFANALFARIVFQNTAGGSPVALRQLYECTADDCTTTQSPPAGPAYAGNWPGASAPPAVSLGTPYTIGIRLDPATRVFSFTLAGGGLSLSETVDASTAGWVTPPFAVDVGPANFLRARLFTAARGQAVGGGAGDVSATFDNVHVGTVGQPFPSGPFDDFNSGAGFDSSRWTVGAQSVQVAGGALRVGLTQQEVPTSTGLVLSDANASALQADVTVLSASAAGGGWTGAILQRTLYNDGSQGAGTAPDLPGPHSYVGDLRAVIGISGTDVRYAVARCDDYQCDKPTFAKPFTSMGSVALQSKHTLYLDWDDAAHTAWFRLDGGAAITFDPVAAGFPKVAPPSVPLKRAAVRAGDASATDHFSAGSSASLTATFEQVKTN